MKSDWFKIFDVRFCVFVIRDYSSMKRELLDVNVNVKKFAELFVTREKGKYFYVKAFC